MERRLSSVVVNLDTRWMVVRSVTVPTLFPGERAPVPWEAQKDGLDPVENRESLALVGNRTVPSVVRRYTE
jgi:hypothetical protein